ncbi:formimidoylglutamase [Nocardia donostiensis]|uniref:Formimidoylglutamase n=1 Tax=Nocardia donostiensis TaxID=1538463 RepID=A0A1W0BP84_9NOCA|nr:formimidoylglutamase [Nocardia donostiensis]ONM47533.1 formimidoylglutamase [Nocardia donostiensis]OQS15124.1 formimidoylglutamase [Nocardia donostiensis]OQS24297.1 formimidoylglutamase [Nocardia donostiensis]
MSYEIEVDTPPQPWSGRTDGPGDEHLRWHHAITPYTPEPGSGSVLIGFASDEGVARNKGRRGAAAGPAALRAALASMALDQRIPLSDAGTVTVGTELEAGQAALGRAVTAALDAGRLPIVLGGGHEVAFGTYQGVAASRLRQRFPRLGILNLDAHFDLRGDPIPSSGTPFRQLAEKETDAGTSYRYSVLGISQPSNTTALFDTAHRLGVRYLPDDRCGIADRAEVDRFVDDFLDDVDLVYLTIDLDVLPAAVAPGVSAPAAYGVPVETIQRVCDRVSTSGKLAVADIAELNPELDIDNRTARTGARLIHRIATSHVPLGVPI